jgi:uncharacterized protein (DUF1810 family)
MSQLGRFKTAQNHQIAGFDAALAELRSGRKYGHWIWYVFPQLSGLGRSTTSQAFGLQGSAEAADYLRDPVLRARLITITRTVDEQLSTGIPLEHLMGSALDAMKLVSSLTLFRHVAGRVHAAEPLEDYSTLARVADRILAAAETEGYPPCQRTLAYLADVADDQARA